MEKRMSKQTKEVVYYFRKGHPHAGEQGVPTGKQIKMPGSGKILHEFTLLDCKHGVDGCFAEKDDVVPDRRSAQ